MYTDRVTVDRTAASALEFYVTHFPHSDRDTWSSRFEQGQIQIDGQPCDAQAPLTAGARLVYHRPPWQESAAPRTFRLIHEDDDLVAVDKPSGLQVLPAAAFLRNTLLDVVRERLGKDLAPIHRLGRGTSGIVLFARSRRARRSLSMALSDGSMKKTYLALVRGTGMPEQFTIDQRIGPIAYPGIGYLHAADKDGKASRSHIRVVESRPEMDATLVEVDIPTGRPHQIRIHLAAAGHPLVGEPLYRVGGRPAPDPVRPGAPLPGDLGYHLHAARVVFVHPDNGEGSQEDVKPMTIESPPPAILRPSWDQSP